MASAVLSCFAGCFDCPFAYCVVCNVLLFEFVAGDFGVNNLILLVFVMTGNNQVLSKKTSCIV